VCSLSYGNQDDTVRENELGWAVPHIGEKRFGGKV
jgi:hypothetical protein